MDKPSEIEELENIIKKLPGVVEVDCFPAPLQDFKMEHLSLGPYGNLPHASLIRTEGGLEGEALGQIFIQFEPSLASWRSLEFLSYEVRDWSRSGIPIQIRSLGLPPRVGDQIQLGTTLRFVIDLFAFGMAEDKAKLLKMIDEFRSTLEESLEINRLDWTSDEVIRQPLT